MSEHVNSPLKWIKIGKVKEAHGLAGEVYVLVFSKDVSWLKKLKQIQLGGQPYVIEKAKAYKDGLILKLKEVSNRNQSESLRGSTLEVPADLFVSAQGETIYLSEIMGFEVFDQDFLVGPITGFSSNGPQDLLVVNHQGRTVEIPFVEAFIKRLDFPSRQVRMELPYGLYQVEEEP